MALCLLCKDANNLHLYEDLQSATVFEITKYLVNEVGRGFIQDSAVKTPKGVLNNITLSSNISELQSF